MERIFSSKLGGTVAQITTLGFENWLSINQPPQEGVLHGQKIRSEPLGTQEHVYGVHEEIDSAGQVRVPLKIDDLDQINAKLKLMNIQRVCINFLNCETNPIHQKQAEKYFSELGFEVFAIDRTVFQNTEIGAWRRNVLNACLWGTFKDLEEEIRRSLLPQESVEIFYGFSGDHTESRWISASSHEVNDLCQTLFAWTAPAQKNGKKFFHLGLENWFFVDPTQPQETWHSPWGEIALRIPYLKKTRLQPTQEVINGRWGGLLPGIQELGFEPGPMRFGRSLRPLVFDFLFQPQMSDLPYQTELGARRFQEQVTAFLRNSPRLKGKDFEIFQMEMKNFIIDSLIAEMQIHLKKDESFYVDGFFAPYFMPEVKKFFSMAQIEGEANPL